MSSLYNLEPQPTAKVVLQTTSGDLSFELFAKQTPLASRNFLQHCLDGYYNNTIFHRLVPGFIIQGGDPTGSGSGGISSINGGEPFQDEVHSRLKYNRRGLLGMANEGKDSNGSQFFITLGATPELQGRNTLFGRIEGDTIYNLMKMAEAELAEGEGSERPLYPTRITGAEILVNPFEDMVARAQEAPRSKAENGKRDVKKRKKPAAKNALSFGGDEGDGDVATPVLKKAKANPRLVVVDENERKAEAHQNKARKDTQHKASVVDSTPPVATVVTAKPVKKPIETSPEREDDDDDDDDEDRSSEDEVATKRRIALEKTKAEIEALKASMKRHDNAVSIREGEKPKSALEDMIPSTSIRGRKRGKAADELGAMDIFKAFKQRLDELPEDKSDSKDEIKVEGQVAAAERAQERDVEPDGHRADDEEANLCELHFIANCQSCRSWDEDKADGDGDANDEEDLAWMSHTLRFTKDTLGKDLEWKRKMEEIEVIDPREKARAIKEEKRKGRDRGRNG